MKNDPILPLTEHLDQLRRVLLATGLLFGLVFASLFWFHEQAFTLLQTPLQTISSYPRSVRTERMENHSSSTLTAPLPSTLLRVTHSSTGVTWHQGNVHLPPQGFIEWQRTRPPQTLALFSPLGGLFTLLSLCLWGSLLLALPVWGALFFWFVWPALVPRERQLAFPGAFLALLAWAVGLLTAHFFVLPAANHTLYQWNAHIAENIWSLDLYLTYALSLYLSTTGIAMISLSLLFATHYRLLSAVQMRRARKGSWWGAFALGALLTPPRRLLPSDRSRNPHLPL